MAKYDKYESRSSKRTEDIHPIWRGIGCIMMILIPALSIIGAMVIIDMGEKEKWPMPVELMGTPRFPALMYSLPVLRDITSLLSGIENLWAIVVISLALMVFGFFLFSFAYSLVYKVVGPPRYSRLDAPEVPRGKRYSR